MFISEQTTAAAVEVEEVEEAIGKVKKGAQSS